MSRTLVLAFALMPMLFACTESASLRTVFESQAEPTGIVRIVGSDGLITIDASPTARSVRGTVDAWARGFDRKGDARAAVESIAIVESGTSDELVLTLDLPLTSEGELAADLFLEVPLGVRVDVLAGYSDVLMSGVEVGDVTLQRGAIGLRDTTGLGVLRTSGGDVAAEAHTGDLDIRTRDAEIGLIDIFGSVWAETTNRAIVASVLPPPRGEVVLTTNRAPIDLALPWDYGAHLLANTTVGDIIVDGLDIFVFDAGFGFLDADIGPPPFGIVDVRTTGADIVVHSL